jgi:hypothetical protein
MEQLTGKAIKEQPPRYRLVAGRSPLGIIFVLAAIGYVVLELTGSSQLSPPTGSPLALGTIAGMRAGIAVLSFAGLVLPGVLLAILGWGSLSVLPAASYFVASVSIPFLRGWGGFALSSYALLALIFACVASPPLVLAAQVGRRSVRRSNRIDAGTFAVSFAAAALLIYVWGRIVNPLPPTAQGFSLTFNVLIACFLFGALAATRRPGWPWAPFVVPALLLSGDFASFALGRELVGEPWPPVRDILVSVPLMPAVLVTLVGSAWQPMSESFHRSPRKYPLFLLLALNALNVADALLTELGIRSGQVAELNPLISELGNVGKVVVVGGFSLLLYRLRPQALFWVLLPLTLVIAYHASGSLFDL